MAISVSIPRRYAKNGTQSYRKNRHTAVSIPRRYAKNITSFPETAPSWPVSIPRRYAKNVCGDVSDAEVIARFQSLVGTLKTRVVFAPSVIVWGFNPS